MERGDLTAEELQEGISRLFPYLDQKEQEDFAQTCQELAQLYRDHMGWDDPLRAALLRMITVETATRQLYPGAHV